MNSKKEKMGRVSCKQQQVVGEVGERRAGGFSFLGIWKQGGALSGFKFVLLCHNP